MRSRLLALPILLVAFVAAVGVSFFASAPARAQVRYAARPASAKAASAKGATTTSQVTVPAPPTTLYKGEPTTLPSPTPTQIEPAVTTTTGVSPPTTVSLATANLGKGRLLFQENCASCHGVDAEGSARAPNLQGVGAATVDFWLSTGRMPLAFPTAQAVIKQPRFDRTQIRDIVKYVTSLSPGGPGIPNVDFKNANMGAGFSLFVTNCAGCHAVTGVGDALSNGLYAPSLYGGPTGLLKSDGGQGPVTPREVLEAMRTGPGNMPRFSPLQLDQEQATDIAYYVTKGGIQHPYDKGGDGLAHVGPITEGFVAIFGGLGAMLGLLWWIGDRAKA